MRKIYSSLLVLLLMAVSTTVNAQAPKLSELEIVKDYTLTLSYWEDDAYGDLLFSTLLDGLYENLNVTAEELDDSPIYTQVLGEDSALADELTPLGKEGTDGWFGRQAGIEVNVPQGWGSTAGEGEDAVNTNTFYLHDVTIAEGMFSTVTGPFPGVLKAGDTDYTYLYIVNGTKAARVKVQVNVKAVLALPETTNRWKELNVLATKNVTIDITNGTTETVTADIAELLAKIPAETEKSAISHVMPQMTYGVAIGDEGASDSLLCLWDADELAIVYDEIERYAFATTANGQYKYTDPLLDMEGKFTITANLKSRKLSNGVSVTNDLWVVYGTDAVVIKVTINVGTPAGLEQMTKVGEQYLEGISTDVSGEYTSIYVPFDLADVLEKLGTTADEVEHWNFADENSFADPTDWEEHDYWQTEQGFAGTWAVDAIAQVYPYLENGEFEITQMWGVFKDIEEDMGPYPLKYVFANGDKYYVINISYTVQAPDPNDFGHNPDEDFNIVANIPVYVQLLPSNYYYDADGESDEVHAQNIRDLNIEAIRSMIGEGSYEIKLLKLPANMKAYPVVSGPSSYTVEPYSQSLGFTGGSWMNVPNEDYVAEHPEYATTSFVGAWGNNASFAIQWDLENGKIGFNQMPGLREVGDFYTSTLYWTNKNNGKTIKFDLAIEFKNAEDITPDITVVGSIDTMVVYSDVITFDKAAIMKKLGIIDDVELESVELYVATSSATYSDEPIYNDYLLFDANGYYTESDDDVHVAATAEGFDIAIDPINVPFEAGDESKAVLRYAFEYDGKWVLYVITIVSEDSPLSIVTTPSQTIVPAGIYSISGARISAPQKGINIVKMSDGSVQKVLVK